MAKVKAVQFVPLGRPPKAGEAMRFKSGQAWTYPDHLADYDHTDGSTEAVERREVEVVVPDTVPAFIDAAFASVGLDMSAGHKAVNGQMARDAVASAFRAHVAERAKAAAERITREAGVDAYNTAVNERVIADAMLR